MVEELKFNNSKDNAIAYIRAIITELGILGANNYEISTLNELIERLEKGECTPEDAQREAEEIKQRKQDYH